MKLTLGYPRCRNSEMPRGIPARLLSVTGKKQTHGFTKMVVLARDSLISVGCGNFPGRRCLRGNPTKASRELSAGDNSPEDRLEI
jgi:hypothetical protein